jgi:hypothetical protein
VFADGGFGFQRTQRLADLADLADGARRNHLRDTGAAHDQRSRKDVWRIFAAGATASPSVRIRPDNFSHGHGLAGQQRFVDLQVLAFDNRRICGNAIALRKHKEISARHLAPWDSLAFAIADTDYAQIAGFGVLSTPGIVIDGKVVHAGGLPKTEDLAKWLAA